MNEQRILESAGEEKQVFLAVYFPTNLRFLTLKYFYFLLPSMKNFFSRENFFIFQQLHK